MSVPAPPDEWFSWVALQAAGVPGTLLAQVLAQGGPSVVLARGRLGDKAVDAANGLERAKLIGAFLESGGRLLGGARPSELGLIATRRSRPFVVFALGSLSLEGARPVIAIVGSREATARGAHWARGMSRQLVEAGAVIVSGGARGIDTIAHEEALLRGGRTVGVSGEPVDPMGRDRRPALFRDAPESALWLTPFGPWVRASRNLFASRNRMIAALADAVIVVEGAADSGTRHTVAAAASLGVPVWCVPGDVETSFACNEWLRTGVALWLDPRRVSEQVLKLPGRASPPPPPPAEGDDPASDDRWSGDGDDVDLAALPAPPLVRALVSAGGRLLVDQAARALGRSTRELLAEVALLELEGLVRRDGAWLAVPPGPLPRPPPGRR